MRFGSIKMSDLSLQCPAFLEMPVLKMALTVQLPLWSDKIAI